MAISSTSYTLTPTPSQVETLKEGEESGLDWDSYLSIGLIRTHTKTDWHPVINGGLLDSIVLQLSELQDFTVA